VEVLVVFLRVQRHVADARRQHGDYATRVSEKEKMWDNGGKLVV
jgi:hypothetical protein